MDKLAINWQNFSHVGLQLKFSFEYGRKVFCITFFNEIIFHKSFDLIDIQ